MKNKVKDWVEHEFAETLQRNGDISACCTRCYGAIMFILSLKDDEELRKWWDDEMRPMFYEMLHAPKYVNTSGVGPT